ncbi:hypothetical protein ACP70R_014315 [Stipagrostis hirtigluma subsp. patula]
MASAAAVVVQMRPLSAAEKHVEADERELGENREISAQSTSSFLNPD